MSTFTLNKITSGNSLTIQQYNLLVEQIQAAIRALQDAPSSGGTVSSVGLVLPSSMFNVGGSPVTSSGNLAGSFISQIANRILASPNGSNGVPSFRSLVLNDLPTIPPTKGGTGLTSLGTAYQMLRVNSSATGYEYFTLTSANGKITVTPNSGVLTIAIVESELDVSNMTGIRGISGGGTGATTQQNAIKNLTAASSGTAGYALLLDSGKNPVWTELPDIVTSKIANNSVTFAKIQTVGAEQLLGNPTSVTGNVQAVGVGANLNFSGTKLSLRSKKTSVITSNYSMVNTDGTIFADATAATITVTLPNVSTVSIDDEFTVKRINSAARTVTLVVQDLANDVIDGVTEQSLGSVYHALTFQYAGVIGGKNTWFITGKVS